MKDTLIFALLAKQIIAIVVVSCGITSSYYQVERLTKHSCFMISIKLNDEFSSNIKLNSNLGEFLQNASLII